MTEWTEANNAELVERTRNAVTAIDAIVFNATLRHPFVNRDGTFTPEAGDVADIIRSIATNRAPDEETPDFYGKRGIVDMAQKTRGKIALGEI